MGFFRLWKTVFAIELLSLIQVYKKSVFFPDKCSIFAHFSDLKLVNQYF